MTLSFVQVAGGFVLLMAGGEALVRGSSGLALRWGLSPLFVGLTVVAFGTSSPELTVSLGAAIDGYDGIAVGNVIGSTIANIGLILGLGARLRPLDATAGSCASTCRCSSPRGCWPPSS